MVNQISVFLENKPAQLSGLAKVLENSEIDMRAMSVAETADFGILRLIVNDTHAAARILKDANYVVSITKVLAVSVPDVPGGLAETFNVLGNDNVNIEYAYAFIARQNGRAYMIFQTEDNEKAQAILVKNNAAPISQEELDRL